MCNNNMKTELEEAAEKMYREYPNNPYDKPNWHYNRDVNCFRKRKAFINGAKWQAERMYSEVFEWLSSKDYLSDKVDVIKKEFEQFKKK